MGTFRIYATGYDGGFLVVSKLLGCFGLDLHFFFADRFTTTKKRRKWVASDEEKEEEKDVV